MRFVSDDPSEIGIIGVGQHAHGILAFGQFARGIIAIGQVAIGVVALGQVSFSVLGVGQVGGGLAWFAGMAGLGGRGVCVRLIPGLDFPRDPPPQVSLEAVMHGGAQGFVRVGVMGTPQGPALTSNGYVLPVKLSPKVAWALDNAMRSASLREVFASLRRERDVVVCDKVVEVPGQRKGAIPFWLNVVRFLALTAMATLWWYLFYEFVI